MAKNGFLTYADSTDANVASDLVYQGSNARQLGVTIGVADPTIANKAWLQSSVSASALMQFVTDWSGQDCLDSTPVATLEANIEMAIAAAQSGAYYAIDTSGTANVINIALDPEPTQIVFNQFQHLWVKVANTNSVGVKLQENAFSQRDVLRNDGTALKAGDLVAGIIYGMVNDGTSFRLSGLAVSQIISSGSVAVAQSPVGKALLSQKVAGAYSFTVPAGVYWLYATCVAAGGGGAGGNSTAVTAGAGGGAGGTAAGWVAVTPGQVISYIVGKGGAGAGYQGAGGNGGSSSIGAIMSATGGGGAGSPAGCAGGPGGVGTGGQLSLVGGAGNDGNLYTANAPGGLGGASSLGGGGRTATGYAASVSNGQAPGSGGGGIYATGANSTGGPGGNGADGYVSFSY
jgi:hypothetical protein